MMSRASVVGVLLVWRGITLARMSMPMEPGEQRLSARRIWQHSSVPSP